MHWPPPPTGQMEITFFHMGQGDATLIRCPSGETILVDGGSSRGFTAEVDFIASVYLRHLVPTRSLYALILTHSDRDHYNQLPKLLMAAQKPAHYPVGSGPDPYVQLPINVQRIYFSNHVYARYRADRGTSPTARRTYDAYLGALDAGPLVHHTSNRTSVDLYQRLVAPRELRLVQLDGQDDHIRRWRNWNHAAPRGAAGNQGAEQAATPNGVAVATGRGWSVRIIAGNVRREATDQSDADGRNASSLVTLVQAGAWKCLICGDATVSTENYLRNHRLADISNVDVLQAPHHGSGVTSSTQQFVAATNPRMVVMSVAVAEPKYHLPGRAVLNSYLTRVGQTRRAHLVDGWELAGNYVRGMDNDAYRLYEAWVKKYDLDPAKAFLGYTLTPEQAKKELGAGKKPVVVAVQPFTGFMLYRRRTSDDVFQTGLDANFTFLRYP
jgi:beta-lactamase superfamily II metal-dependent hydrolase